MSDGCASALSRSARRRGRPSRAASTRPRASRSRSRCRLKRQRPMRRVSRTSMRGWSDGLPSKARATCSNAASRAPSTRGTRSRTRGA